MRVIALVDGEHYPPVIRWAIERARAIGLDVVAALLVGGGEKLDVGGSLDLGDVPVTRAGPDRMRALHDALQAARPDGVLDLSDEPVLGDRQRFELAAVTLALGLPYLGPDFRFDPPITEEGLPAATIAVIGTGKRVAKTAIGGHLARLAAADGRRPWIVAMGRGGPDAPVVAGPGDVSLDALLALADRGEHAASDYLEDALTSGVPTVGARRCGGGLGGKPFASNVAEAARLAASNGADPVILEGSGASIPTVPWDAGVLVVPAGLEPELLGGHLCPLRILLSDLAVFMIGVGPTAGPDNLSALQSLVRRLRPHMRVAVAELQPVALSDVSGKDAFFATTAGPGPAERLSEQLQRTSGCRVVKVSSKLADRAGLEADLASAPPFDVLLTELKAAAVDVAARRAVERGAEVAFVDNRPASVGGDGDVDDLLRDVVGLAAERAGQRLKEAT
jgi:cyclic 2,3-diphosphoglycerate synthase